MVYKIIEFLFKNKLVHFDIKADNFVVDNNLNIRLIDFGGALIISEFNSKIIHRTIVNGLFIGILIHIFIDIFLSGGKILFYWPLPINAIDSLFKIDLNYELLYILSCLQFLLLRYFGYKLNLMLIKMKYLNGNCCKSINSISRFMKYQFILFLLFLMMFVFKIKFSIALIDFSIFSSLLVALYFSYNIKEIFNKDIKVG